MKGRAFDEPTRKWLCSKGYAIEKEGNEELVSYLKETLMAKPKVNPDMPNADAEPFPVYREDSTWIYIPKVFGLQQFGAPSKVTLRDGVDAPGLVFEGKPRAEQDEPIQRFVEAANDPVRGGGLLVLPCGFGKTVLALYLSTVFKKKTLIICHKGFLMDQWKERIAQYVPKASVGTIKQSKVDVDGKDIVIASLQSLAMREYDASIFRDFGFVVIDEVHHIGAEVFSRALPRIVCKRTLGLSATPNRKDGLRKVFEWHIGKPVYEVRKRSDNQLKVIVKRFYDPNPSYGREIHMYNGKRNVAQMINAICAFEPRNQLIIDTLVDIKKEEPGRQVILLSERRNHLETLRKMIKAKNLGTTGYYVGGMSQDELKKSETKDFILATYHIAAEGFDVPSLNTLVLASPVSSIEQPVGRIQRQKPHERKYVPLVIDIWDNFSLFNNQGFRRIQFYKKNGYEVCGYEEPQEEDQATTKKYTFIADDD
jgi:superfamily II DNA or RNA helicase